MTQAEGLGDYFDRIGRSQPIPGARPDLHQIKDLLDTREASHGDYPTGARTIQGLKGFFHRHEGWSRLDDCQKESIDMICCKLGRAMNGDHNNKDTWDDIAGYAVLVAERCK